MSIPAGLCLALLFTCAAACSVGEPALAAGSQQEPVVYAADSLLEWNEFTGFQELASSELALIPQSLGALDALEPHLVIDRHPGLCPDEPWMMQPSLAACSAVWLGGRWVLTAAHCLDAGFGCGDYRIVSEFRLSAAGSLEPLGAANEYRCVRVVAGSAGSGAADFVVIEIDRELPALPPRWSDPSVARLGAALTGLAHPLGTPLKVDPESRLLSVHPPRVMTDAFIGSSGGPLFDETGALLGIVTDGAEDFELDPRGCWSTRHLPAPEPGGGSGEIVVWAVDAVRQACAVEPSAAPCEWLPECTDARAANCPTAYAAGGCSVGNARSRVWWMFVALGILRGARAIGQRSQRSGSRPARRISR